jgi:predicted nucleic acid-binding protein
MEIVLDASAIMAVIVDEPESKTGKSPFEDIPRIKLEITTQEIVEILNECRAGI